MQDGVLLRNGRNWSWPRPWLLSLSPERSSNPSLRAGIISSLDRSSIHSHSPRGAKGRICARHADFQARDPRPSCVPRERGQPLKGLRKRSGDKQDQSRSPEMHQTYWSVEEGGPQGLNPRSSVPIPGKILAGKYQTGGHECLGKNAAAPGAHIRRAPFLC